MKALVIALVLCVVACSRPVPPPPAPPPAAPPTPTPAPPPPALDTTPEPDQYARLKAMTAEQVDALGLLPEVRFDYDTSQIRADQYDGLVKGAEVLRRFDFLALTIEGHCDERGTIEYNLALGERRARAVLDALVALDIEPGRLSTTSLGKEAPVCTEPSEECWARNRRARLRVTSTGR